MEVGSVISTTLLIEQVIRSLRFRLAFTLLSNLISYLRILNYTIAKSVLLPVLFVRRVTRGTVTNLKKKVVRA